ncbi:MAG: F0F1 ATP synthase subunit delta [Candidatus Magasanikbacteria bacterium]|jgi:F-type H+-transporting ATPase subunit delta|nr:F0F1 ATP synthase subunit delta [Candidatus Magasanikbacteria bacterium]
MPQMIPLQMGKVLYEVTLEKTGPALDEAIRLFLEFCQKQQLISRMHYILEAFEAYAEEQQGITRLHVTTAHSLSSEVTRQLKEHFGNSVAIGESTDETILGGIVVQTPDVILDGSVKTQLTRVATYLK